MEVSAEQFHYEDSALLLILNGALEGFLMQFLRGIL